MVWLDHVYIPCHYQAANEKYKNLILYFHGNAEDIGLAANFTKKLAIGLKVFDFIVTHFKRKIRQMSYLLNILAMVFTEENRTLNPFSKTQR